MKIKKLTLQNFKGCKSKEYVFNGNNATIYGANGTGKTTLFDAMTWLLFGRDSLDNAKFEIRPLDANGKQIDNIDICVSAILLTENGKEIELKKTQSQNWVKKRGSEFPTFQGNVNSYEVDGYPKAEKDFKEYINDIVNDDLFKMLTNPTYFPNMPWKEQRNILINLVPGFDDVEYAAKNEKFAPLLDELEKAPSLDDIKAKYAKSINALKKQQIEIPVRIDEISNSKVDIDVAELELLKKSLNEKIEYAKAQMENENKLIDEYNKASDGIIELKMELGDLERKANAENVSKKNDLELQIDKKEFDAKKIKDEIEKNQRTVNEYKNRISFCEKEKEEIAELWKKAKNETFDESTIICPTCGRQLPDEQVEEIRTTFDRKKAVRLENIEHEGNSINESIAEYKAEIAKLDISIIDKKTRIEKINDAILELRKKLDEIPNNVDISKTKEYVKISKQIKEKETAMREMKVVEDRRKSVNYGIVTIQQELIEVEKKIALSSKNVEIDERIEELQAELKDVGIKIAAQEKILYLLDEFIKCKLDKISNSINSMFKGVCFKLFDTQINGGIKEVCECTVNGVPYGSLNNGHRLVAGLQIIKALQAFYNQYMPIFVDNAESLNDFNIPEMDCQLIKLKVSEDKTLRIEREEK